jgi:hypothetical protein
VSQQEQDELQRYYEALGRVLSGREQDPEVVAHVKSQGERIRDLERRLIEERREKQRLEAEVPEEVEERVPHQPHQVIWLEPRCSSCGSDEYENERLWSKDNVWEDGCETCGLMPVKYVLAPDQARSKDP